MLTIDSRIQYLAETHLKDAVLEKGAKGGVAIVSGSENGRDSGDGAKKDSIPTTSKG